CPVAKFATDEMNNAASGHLVDYVKSPLMEANVKRYNPLAQIATYLLLLRMAPGVITTLNQTTFVWMDTYVDSWALKATEKFDVSKPNPLAPEQPWSLFEIWVRFILASIGVSRTHVVPEPVKTHFRMVAVAALDAANAKKQKSANAATPQSSGG